VSVRPDKAAAFKKVLGDLPHEELGVVTGGVFEVDGTSWGNVGEWKEKYDHAIENYMAQLVEME
jgi:hypothetical protein